MQEDSREHAASETEVTPGEMLLAVSTLSREIVHYAAAIGKAVASSWEDRVFIR
jgi:hypothetical protein